MTMRYLTDVVTLELNADKCTGCGTCLEVCPHGVFTREDDKARITDRDACIECGACALNCPEVALSVEAGVGCANALIRGMLRGTAPGCDCSGDSSCCT